MNDDTDDAQHRKNIASLGGIEFVAVGDEKRENGCHDGKTSDQNEIGRHGREVWAGADMLHDRREEGFFLGAALFLGEGLRQYEEDENGIRERECSREIERGGFPKPGRRCASQRGTEDKTQAKCRANEPHGF